MLVAISTRSPNLSCSLSLTLFSLAMIQMSEIENQTSLKIKCLRYDNGREYNKSKFKAFCAAKGIRLMRTVLGKARQIGIVERMNRTLNEWAKSMRIHSELLKTFRTDVVNSAIYLINKGPSIPLEFKL